MNLPTNPRLAADTSDGSLKLYPFQCFLAHDQAVRTLQWCKANRYGTGRVVALGGEDRLTLPELFRLTASFSHLSTVISLKSAGSDRKIKFWDLRRPYEPINSIKRFLTQSWPGCSPTMVSPWLRTTAMPPVRQDGEDELWEQALRVGVHCASLLWGERVVSLRESGFWGKK